MLLSIAVLRKPNLFSMTIFGVLWWCHGNTEQPGDVDINWRRTLCGAGMRAKRLAGLSVVFLHASSLYCTQPAQPRV